MASIHSEYEYDIFVSYRQNDNKRDGWVSKFVQALGDELEAIIKTPISIYFDENPHDGLHDTHLVELSLKKKLKAVVFIPIISQTYCDETGFAWSNEFLPFINTAASDCVGMHISLQNGNVASRILPVKIHDIDLDDQAQIEKILNSHLRSIDFIYKAAGVNRPLNENDDQIREPGKVLYSDQINKVANALKDITNAVKLSQEQSMLTRKVDEPTQEFTGQNTNNTPRQDEFISMDESLLIRLNEIVNKNLDNEKFSVEELASEMAISRSHLHRKLQSLTGRSISQYVRSIRLNQAFRMLQAEVGTVSEIAYKVGFASNTYFIKCFSEEYGFSPGEARKQQPQSEIEQPEAKVNVIEQSTAPQQLTSRPLEALHPAASESMIIDVFRIISEHKPSLQKFLLIDEEEDETIDTRLLAYQLIKAYPWPIGIELRRLFSASLLKAEPARRDQLNKTIIRCLKLIAFVFTSDIINQVNKDRFKFSKLEATLISESLAQVTPNSIRQLLETLSEAIKDAPIELFVEEIQDCFDETFFREINDWIEDYNRGSSDLDITEQCEGLEQVLLFLLERFAFLVKYRLVNMGAIEVKKRKYKDVSFEHKLQILSSVDADFVLRRELLEEYADSQAVLLMKSIKNPQDFLNLSPLLVDTHGVETESQDKESLRRDIFLLDRYNDNSLIYYGSESNVVDKLEYLDYHKELVSEYLEMLNLINGNG